MKALLLLTLIIPGLSFAANPSEDITCALDKVHNTWHPGKAGEVIYLRHIGENVFKVSRFTAYTSAKNYRVKHGEGLAQTLRTGENGNFILSNRIMITPDLKLIENTSGGGFPGAGQAPARGITFKCIEGYSFSQDQTKAEIRADFDL